MLVQLYKIISLPVEGKRTSMSFKVYVALGFHINFYHSWRGDTPDEAGFGTDIRVIRKVLEILNNANGQGLKSRAYWDTEVYWTFQEILPKHSPDILDGIRRRVEAGWDEMVVGPFNNGANHAATTDEFGLRCLGYGKSMGQRIEAALR